MVPVEILLAGSAAGALGGLTKITGWGDPLVASLAAWLGVGLGSIMWLREPWPDDKLLTLCLPNGGWKRVRKMDSAAVLLLDTVPAAAAASPSPAAEPTCVAGLPPSPKGGAETIQAAAAAPIERLPGEMVARVFCFLDPKTLMMTIPSVSDRFERSRDGMCVGLARSLASYWGVAVAEGG